MTVLAFTWLAAGFLLFYSVGLTLASWIRTRLAYPRWIRRLPPPADELRANIVVPCQEDTEYLEGNLRAMAEQDYPSYTLTLVTDSDADGAVGVIRSIVRDYPRARHHVAGYASTRCSQQNYVQSVAMSADTTSDVLVKLDSDMRPHKGWLREFLRPYSDPKVDATSSHHWISPPRPGFVNGCYTLFSGWLSTLMGVPGLPWIWGGCFGVRRSVFRELDIASLWTKTGTDDSTLRTCLVRARKRVVFVPACVAPARETHEELAGFVRWMSRQAFHGKVYVPCAWAAILFAETAVCLTVLVALVILVAVIVGGPIGAEVIPALVVLAAPLLGALLMKLGNLTKADLPLWWWPALSVPTHVLSCWATWRTLFMRRLRWRGHVYEFNPDGTVRNVARLPEEAGRPAGAAASGS